MSSFHEAPNPFPSIDEDQEELSLESVNRSELYQVPSFISSSEVGAGRLMRRESDHGDDGAEVLGDVEEYKVDSVDYQKARAADYTGTNVVPTSNPETGAIDHQTANISDEEWMPIAKARGWGPIAHIKKIGGTYGFHRVPGAGAAKRFNGFYMPPNMDVPSPSQMGFQIDGLVKVKNIVSNDETATLIIREENAKCLLIRPVFECMHQFGSYGINRMYTETFQGIDRMEWKQPDWMKDSRVQRKRIFDLTLPMSRSSAAFDAAGTGYIVGEGLTASVITQTLDILQQLQLGIRALEIPIAVNIANSEVWATWGVPNVPLARVLKDIDEFLSENQNEVIILAMKHTTLLDDNLATIDHELLDAGLGVLPGEKAHMLVAKYLEKYLALYDKLSTMSEPRQNPSVAELVSKKARVLYFWEGQQVLCLNYTQCQATPGWEVPSGNYSRFTFGKPYKLGTRPLGTGRSGSVVLEPACIMPSKESTAAFRPNSLYKKMLAFINATSGNETLSTVDTPCWLMDEPGPGLHEPNLLIELDAYLILDELQMHEKNTLLAGDKDIFTAGEPLSWRSGAERMNFNLLVWFFKKGNRDLFMRPNIISLEMIHPALIQRITEANQNRQDCGIALHCKDSGSCWAMTLAKGENGCIEENDAVSTLTDYANDELPLWAKALIALAVIVFASLLVVCCCCCCMNTYKMVKGARQKTEEQGLVAAADEAAAEELAEEVAQEPAESRQQAEEEGNLEF